MNTQNDFESGVVEAYVLGVLTHDEKRRFEVALSGSAPLQRDLKNFESQVEYLAIANKIPPPPSVWREIQYRIHDMPGAKEAFGKERGDDTLEIYGVSNTEIRVHKYWRPAFIAIFVLSKIFLALAIFYYINYRQTVHQVERLEQEVKEMRLLQNAAK